MEYDSDYSEGWDCDPFAVVIVQAYDYDIDETSDDWQIIALDRFSDRNINGELR